MLTRKSLFYFIVYLYEIYQTIHNHIAVAVDVMLYVLYIYISLHTHINKNK